MRLFRTVVLSVLLSVAGGYALAQTTTYELDIVGSTRMSTLGITEGGYARYLQETAHEFWINTIVYESDIAQVTFQDGSTVSYLKTEGSDGVDVLHGRAPMLSVFMGERFVYVTVETRGLASSYEYATGEETYFDIYDVTNIRFGSVTDESPPPAVPERPDQSDESEWTTTEFGSIRIDRVWKGSNDAYPVIYALVTYRNTTEDTFASITLTGRAISDDGSLVAQNRRSFFEHKYGEILPGFQESVEIPIDIPSLDASSLVRVSVRTRR